MSKTIHLSLSVRGALGWPLWEQRNALRWMFRDDGTKFGSVAELRNALMDELAAGHEVVPMAKECDNFDFKTGCKGHEDIR